MNASSPGVASFRQTTALMRFALLLGAFLTFVTGVQLVVLTSRTAEFFAWTIAAAPSAIVIGAFYWTATVLSFLSWRQRDWAASRVGVPGVTIFLWATLATTVLHADKFHFAAESAVTARFAAWAWLVIYIADPVLVTFALVRQAGVPGADPPRSSPLPGAYRALLVAAAGLFMLLGALMLAVPAVFIDRAPWPLTPLTCRTIGAWVLAMGGVFGTMAREDDALRIRPAAIASVTLPTLLCASTLRDLGEFRRGPPAVVVAALVATVALIGVAGLLAARSRAGSLAAASGSPLP